MSLAGPVHPCGTPGLGAWDQIGCYCERAADPGLWAEPLNALSNAAFFVAALMAHRDLRAAETKAGGLVLPAMILLMMAVGSGSVLFHTLATRWAMLADVIPIGAFVFGYVALAWRWFVGTPFWAAVGFAVAVTMATFAMPPGLNGSMLYLPALTMLGISAALLFWRGHPVWPWLAAATSIFILALVARTLDRTELVCGAEAVGSHWAWHVLNGVTLYLLMRAAIEFAPVHGAASVASRKARGQPPQASGESR